MYDFKSVFFCFYRKIFFAFSQMTEKICKNGNLVGPPKISFSDARPVPINNISMDDGLTILSDFILPTDPALFVLQKLVFIDLLSHDLDIVTSALKSIQKLCEIPSNEKFRNRRRLLTVGAHAVLLLAIKKWCASPVVMTIAFRVLHYGATQKEFALVAAKIGLLKTVMSGMEAFPLHRLLQQSGCGVLYTMARVSHSLARTVFTGSDGLHLIVRSLLLFPTDSCLQKFACDAITLYIGRRNIRTQLRVSGLADALVSSIIVDCKKAMNGGLVL